MDPQLPGGGVMLRQVWRDLPVEDATAITVSAWKRVARHPQVARQMRRLGVSRAVEALADAGDAVASDSQEERRLHLVEVARQEMDGAAAALGSPVPDTGSGRFGSESSESGPSERDRGWRSVDEVAAAYPHLGNAHRPVTPAVAHEAVRQAGDLMARLCDGRITSNTVQSVRDLWMPGRDLRTAFSYLGDEIHGEPLAVLAADAGFESEMGAAVERLGKAMHALLSNLDWKAAAAYARRATTILRTHPRLANTSPSPYVDTADFHRDLRPDLPPDLGPDFGPGGAVTDRGLPDPDLG
jgi:hypothetical protein